MRSRLEREVRRQSAAGHDAVDMRVPLKSLSPSVENAEEANLGSEMGWIGGNFHQRSGAGLKQQAEKIFLFCQINGTNVCGTLKTRWK